MKSIQLYLEHLSQKWFFIEMISTYEYQWQLVCQGFTDCAVSNLSWNSIHNPCTKVQFFKNSSRQSLSYFIKQGL